MLNAGCRLPIEDVDTPVWEPETNYEPTAADGARDAMIVRVAEEFGPVDPLAMQEIMPVHDEVHVAINVIRPNKRNPFMTLFTTGMSSLPMRVPAGQEEYRFAELLMHLPATWPHPRGDSIDETSWPMKWLRQLAYFPHLHETSIGAPLTIISSAEPPEPLGPNTKQSCLLLIADFADWSPVVLGDGKRIHFFTVFPIYTEERDFEREHGSVPLMERLFERGHTAVVTVNRSNVALEP